MSRVAPVLLAITVLFAAPAAYAQQGVPAAIQIDGSSTIFLPQIGTTVAFWVLDADGNGVEYPQVTFQRPASGPSADVMQTYSGLEDIGIVAFRLYQLGGFGTYQVTASAGAASVTLTVTNGPDPIRIVGGTQMSTLIGTPFPEPIVIETINPDGSPYAGAIVTVDPQSHVTLGSGPYVTGPDGMVTIAATATSLVGIYDVRATVATSFATADVFIRLSNLAEAPAFLSSLGDVELPAGGEPGLVRVQVRTPAGLPARGVAVTFEYPTDGPGIDDVLEFSGGPPLVRGNSARVLTDFDGNAELAVSANTVPGSYVVTARVDGVGVANINVTNVLPTLAAIKPNGFPWEELRGEAAPVTGRFESLRFRAVDTNGNGMPGVSITLTPEPTAATVTLDRTTIVTGEDGYADTGGTANHVAGSYYVKSEAAGLDSPAYMFMKNRPPGFVVGEQIADFTALDQDGVVRSVSSLLTGSNYLILDVCAVWCVVCQAVQSVNLVMQAELAAMGIDVTVVPLLSQSAVPNEASTQTHARQWRQRFGLIDPVLHAAGDTSSPLYSAANFILGADRPAFPTFLLIAPDGTIVDRRVSGWVTTDEAVNFVLPHVPGAVRVNGVSITEGAGAATIAVTRSRATGPAAVSYTTIAGTASPADFTSRSGVVSFADGQTSATISVPITNDTVDEPNEQFTVRLSNPSGLRIEQGDAIVTIADNDAAPAISVQAARFAEGTGAATNAALAVTLDRASAFTVAVKYSIVAGTAKSSDVQLTSGTLTFAAGDTTGSIPLAITPDKTVEIKETFAVRLSSPSNATLAAAEALVSIVDDDADTAAPMLQIKGDVVLEVKMDAKATVTVDYDTPGATDKRDGTVPVSCVAPSGSKLPLGVSEVSCAAEDRAGNLAVGTFQIIVRLPTTPGALFAPHDQSAPLTEARRGDRVLVHVNAGAFGRRDKVTLTFIDAKGRRHALGHGRADRDGSLDEVIEIPRDAANGLGQVSAGSGDGAEYDRAWFITVKKAKKPRHR